MRPRIADRPRPGKLKELLGGVKLLMSQSTRWREFKLALDRFYPKFGETMQLPFEAQVYRLPRPD
jgi:hypothetical protein